RPGDTSRDEYRLVAKVGELPQLPCRRRQRPEITGDSVEQGKRQPLAIWGNDRLESLGAPGRNLRQQPGRTTFRPRHTNLEIGPAGDNWKLDRVVQGSAIR